MGQILGKLPLETRIAGDLLSRDLPKLGTFPRFLFSSRLPCQMLKVAGSAVILVTRFVEDGRCMLTHYNSVIRTQGETAVAGT